MTSHGSDSRSVCILITHSPTYAGCQEEGKFACSLYPRDKEFLSSVATEVDDQIRRLSHHASISVYSGNNENMSPGMSSDATLIDYSALYDDTLQVAVRATDRSRPYWAASPSNGNTVDEPDRGLFIQRWGDENDARYGDAHIYPQFGRSVPGKPDQARIIDCEDLSRFQTARFVSEYHLCVSCEQNYRVVYKVD